MWYFKSCPHCKGDVFEATDVEGPVMSCLQCGATLTATEMAQLKLSRDRVRVSRPEDVALPKAA